MKPTWNSSSLTPVVDPKKVTAKNVKARMYWAAILFHCTIDWLTCYNFYLNLYLSSHPGPWAINHLSDSAAKFTMSLHLK